MAPLVVPRGAPGKASLSKSLIIVESPAKAKTLKKFLGGRYQVLPSVGHVRDLPKSRLGVDVDNRFAPSYITIKGKGPVIKELRSAVKKAKHVYLAPDPDREGEAIAWHLAELLKLPDPLRIELHEITKKAVDEALKHPRPIDRDRVDAQQARRVLDRLVGYKISPLLWTKIRGGLSAGRVQSVALKMIVDREREITAFQRHGYWTIGAHLWPHGHHDAAHTLLADLVSVDGERTGLKGETALAVGSKSTYTTDEAGAKALEQRLGASKFVVSSVKQSERRDNPKAPFTTSTMQQEASRRLKMRVRKAMQIAQGLYEGVDIGADGTTGLITYMRTDSTRVSPDAQAAARDFIVASFGDAFHGGRQYKISEDAQDAHEAIRPTDVRRTPESLKQYLDAPQFKLYRLIWERFVASQMSPAVYDQTTVEIEAAGCVLRATGSVLKFAGYTKLYEDVRDEDTDEDDDRRKHLPPVEQGRAMDLREVVPESHETQPPPRFTEASLVKTLEEKGIGRPSTYATIVETIQARGYARLNERRFQPEEIGYKVVDFITAWFPQIVNETFTSELEAKLDRVEDAHVDWPTVLGEFWLPFSGQLDRAEEAERVELEEEQTDELCPTCGRPMKFKMSRFGKFLGCSGYPECQTTKQIVKDTGSVCPRDGGRIVEKRGRKSGKVFYGCENFNTPAKCDFVLWDPPIKGAACAQCGAMLVRKNSRKASRVVCSAAADHETGFIEPPEQQSA
jgi:DNA topoisomerase-1